MMAWLIHLRDWDEKEIAKNCCLCCIRVMNYFDFSTARNSQGRQHALF